MGNKNITRDDLIINRYFAENDVHDEGVMDAIRKGYYLAKEETLIDKRDIVKMSLILALAIVVVFSIFSLRGCGSVALSRDGFTFSAITTEAKISEYARFKGVTLSEWRIGQIMSKTANKSEKEANQIIIEIIDDAPTK